MTNSALKQLCISLAQAESEKKVVSILEKAGYWDDPSSWRDYGNNPNNFSTIGNQQSSADTALVEKIVNSVDAVLMRECLGRGIKADGKDAPGSIEIAQRDFFGIYDGKLSSIGSSQRADLAQKILVVATGKKGDPCYSIIDHGEGQSPSRMPETLLSLNKSNKLKIPFVQGKFNMGGTGALQFCSKNHNMQLIISRRDPRIARNEKDDDRELWGFTVVRREDPDTKSGMRSSTFRYLAPSGKIMSFSAASLSLLPGEYPDPYGQTWEYGTLIKLYEYQLKGFRTTIKLDPYYRLSLLLPGIALPVTLFERREGYSAHTQHAVLSGLSVRLDEDKRDNLEPGFPSSAEITALGQKMDVRIYAFRKGQRENYSKNEGVIFSVNGQAHGFLPSQFFDRKSVGMSYLSDSILIMIDCSNFEGRAREDLFMNSRDRLREGSLKADIERQLEDLIKNHQGLRDLRERRRREEVENRLQDQKPLAEMLENIIKKSPSLASLFVTGTRLKNPFNFTDVAAQDDFEGKRYPTYFKLTKRHTEKNPKQCPQNRKFRVQFETDAENDYFNRDKDPGDFSLTINGSIVEDYSLNLWNGTATLTAQLPKGSSVGSVLEVEAGISDISKVDPLGEAFFIRVAPPVKGGGGEPGERKDPASNQTGKDHKSPSRLALPNIVEIRHDDWERQGFDERTALQVKDDGQGGYDFFVNMDNVHLKSEIKVNTKIDSKILEARFKFGLVLIGIAILEHFEHQSDADSGEVEEGTIYKQIGTFTRATAPILLPMISSLGDLELD